jgi:NAD(P)-dependent dehydrogenase (short-subunit alcohol dehydrogenase family)
MREPSSNFPSPSRLKGQVIFITGAGSGIGAGTALELHRRGATVVLFDIDKPGLENTAAQLGGEVLTIAGDVTDLAACEAAVARTLARHGHIDTVWANAGMAAFGPLALTDPGAWKRCIDVNVIGVFNTVRAALPAVTARRGYVAVTASVASFAHAPFMSAYAASKAGVEAMCNAWRIELAAHGVAVGAIHAHWVTTPMVTEGALHPAFARLRKTMPGLLNRETPVERAAHIIADGMQRRARQVWVPAWVRTLHWLRAWLHTAPAERELLRAAPEMEATYLEGMASAGTLASSYGPREHERLLAQLQRRQSSAAQTEG